jgi:uncharacterized protein (DUF302 family)
MRIRTVLIFLFLSCTLFASNHGIYLLAVSNIKGDFNKVGEELKIKLKSGGYNILNYTDIVAVLKLKMLWSQFAVMKICVNHPKICL